MRPGPCFFLHLHKVSPHSRSHSFCLPGFWAGKPKLSQLPALVPPHCHCFTCPSAPVTCHSRGFYSRDFTHSSHAAGRIGSPPCQTTQLGKGNLSALLFKLEHLSENQSSPDGPGRGLAFFSQELKGKISLGRKPLRQERPAWYLS